MACGTQLPFRITSKPVEITPVCDPDDTVCLMVKTADETTMRPKPRSPGEVYDDTAAVMTGELLPGAERPEDLDTSTAAEVAAATAAPAANSESKLGKTIVSLGDVTLPGFWLETPLVSTVANGRVIWAENGNSVTLELRPRDGEKSSGSQISLAAMRALGVPLTALPELIVFRVK